MKILGRELSRLEQWTSVRQKACSTLSVFVDIISWGHICTDRLFDDYSAGSCFFPGPTQTSQVHTIWKRPRLYNLNHCFDFGLVWEDSLCQTEEFRFKEACWEWKLKRSLNNVYNLWICILVLCDKSPCPIPPNQTINWECLCPCMCSISMSTSSIAARWYI